MAAPGWRGRRCFPPSSSGKLAMTLPRQQRTRAQHLHRPRVGGHLGEGQRPHTVPPRLAWPRGASQGRGHRPRL